MFENQIGPIIRINRIQQNMSIRALAETVGIEYSQLSKIERGLEFSTPLTIESIFEALDLHYDCTIELITSSNEKFDKLYQDIFYRKPRQRIEIQLNELNKQVEAMGMSTPTLLINIIFDVLYNDKNPSCSGTISLLKKVEESMTAFQKQLFHQYSGFYLFLKGDSKAALEHLNYAETLFLHDNSSAMIAYQKGVIYNHRGDIFDAYEQLNKAKNLFERHHNYIRSAICSVTIASVHLSVDKYEKAMSIYYELLNSYEDLLMDKEDVALICANMLLGTLLANQFKQFFKIEATFQEDIVDCLHKNEKYIFYRIIALYNTQRYEECSTYILRFEDMNKRLKLNPLIAYYKSSISTNSHKRIYRTLKVNFNKVDKCYEHNFVRLILKLIIKEYEGSGDYETLYYYALKLTDINL